MSRTRILVADDHVMLTDALVSFLSQECDVIGVARDGQAMVEMALQHHPDVIVVDIQMPLVNGIEAVRLVRQELPSAKVLVLSMHSDLSIVEEAFRAGASGYMLKTGGLDELLKAIRCTFSGGRYVTPLLGDVVSSLVMSGAHNCAPSGPTTRQRQVLQLLAEGKTMKEIGQELKISPKTIESHKYEIMRTFGLKTTAELVRYAVRNKLVQVEPM
jgi:DNA-binding NarL/FixJ family response regulator